MLALFAAAPNEAIKTGITFFSTWIARIGGIVAFIGAVKFALSVKSEDGKEQMTALLVMVSGFMIRAAIKEMNLFNSYSAAGMDLEEFNISEGQITDDVMLSRDFNGMGIIVSDDFFNEIVKDVHELSTLFLFTRANPVCHLTQQECDNIVDYFRMLKQKTDDLKHHFRRETVRSLLTTMIYDLSNIIFRMQTTVDRRQTRGEAIFTQFLQLVELNFRHERRVSWYAKQLCISPKYLSEIIKQVSRRTPNDWIDNFVTLEIRVLLRNSTKSIKEIAQELNFPNQSFFGKFFKEHVGLSPSQYRNKG